MREDHDAGGSRRSSGSAARSVSPPDGSASLSRGRWCVLRAARLCISGCKRAHQRAASRGIDRGMAARIERSEIRESPPRSSPARVVLRFMRGYGPRPLAGITSRKNLSPSLNSAPILMAPCSPPPPACSNKMERRLDALSGVEDWVLHDLRRTCVSGMARLRIAPHIADKILNHQSGTISGVVAVYRLRSFYLSGIPAMTSAPKTRSACSGCSKGMNCLAAPSIV